MKIWAKSAGQKKSEQSFLLIFSPCILVNVCCHSKKTRCWKNCYDENTKGSKYNIRITRIAVTRRNTNVKQWSVILRLVSLSPENTMMKHLLVLPQKPGVKKLRTHLRRRAGSGGRGERGGGGWRRSVLLLTLNQLTAAGLVLDAYL